MGIRSVNISIWEWSGNRDFRESGTSEPSGFPVSARCISWL